MRFVRRLIQAEIDEENRQKVLQKPDGLQAVTIDELAQAPGQPFTRNLKRFARAFRRSDF